MLTQRYSIDIVPGGVPLTLHVTQYDAGMTEFVFVPFASSGAIDLSVVTTARIEATKPDRLAVVNNCTYANGEATYLLQKQLTAKAGSVWSKLVLLDVNNNVIASKAIVWEVDRPGVTDDATVSESDIPLLREAIEASAESVSSSEESEAWAVGKRNGVDVGTDDPAYHNNAKYYAGQSSGVKSVNGKTGAVVLTAADVDALPDNTAIPTKTSDLTNDSGFITSADVPTKTSDLTNDSGFITSADVPTKTSDLTNDSGFITSAAVPTKVSDLTNDSGYVTASTAPVRSVNGRTGAVSTKCVIVDCGTISSLPKTITNAKVLKDMVVVHSELGTPSAMTSEWTVNTDTAGQFTIRGTISGSTTLKLYFIE